MRVLFVANDLESGVDDCGDILLSGLADGMARLGLDVAVAGLTQGQAFRLGTRDDKQSGAVALAQGPVWSPYATFDSRRPAAPAELLSHFVPEVVHTGGIDPLGPFGWASLRRWGAAVVHSLRDQELLCALGGRGAVAQAVCGQDGDGAQCGGCRIATRRRRCASLEVDAVVAEGHRLLKRHLAAGYFSRAVCREVIPKDHNRDGLARAYLGVYEKLVAARAVPRTVEASQSAKRPLAAPALV